jgi:hypothetical protein
MGNRLPHGVRRRATGLTSWVSVKTKVGYAAGKCGHESSAYD